MKKNLVYYCVGGESEYSELLKLSISSIRKTNPIDQHILIISNIEYYYKHLADIKDNYILFHFIENNESKIDITYNKLKVFEFLETSNYFEKVLFLDVDTIVNLNLSEIFSSIENHKLNVVVEDYNIKNHERIQFSLLDYETKDLDFFRDNNIYTFNSGTFGFYNTLSMKRHFSNVIEIIKNHKGLSYFEQSFLNSYFNKLALVSYTAIRKDENYLYIDDETQGEQNTTDKIIHIIGREKNNKMKIIYDKIFKGTGFDDRTDLIKNLSKLINGKKGVEIGVFKGEFSKYILNNWDGILYMVDVWRPLDDTYNDSSNMINHTNAYQETMDAIKGMEDRGIMIRADSKRASEMFEDESLDFIYIDANHAYDFIKEDIDLWFPKLKKGGVFSGHDYIDLDWNSDPNFAPNGKDKYIYVQNNDGEYYFNGIFGVNPAVDEFCQKYGYTINKTKEWFGTWWLIK